MATIASLLVNILARTDGLRDGLNRARGQLRGFGGAIRSIASSGAAQLAGLGAGLVAAFSVHRLSSFVKEQGNAIDELGKMAERLGVTTEEMTGFERAAALSGVTVEQVEKAISRMQRTLLEAQMGGREASETLARLGLNVDHLASMDPAAQFGMMADAIMRLPPGMERMNAAMRVFGRSGGELLNFLKEGSAGFDRMSAQAKKAGTSFAAVDFQAVQNANDSITKLELAVQGLGRQFAIALAPSIQVAAENLEAFIVTINRDDFQGGFERNIAAFLDWVHAYRRGILAMDEAWQELRINFATGMAALERAFVTSGQEPVAWEAEIHARRQELEALREQIRDFDSQASFGSRYQQELERVKQANRDAAAATQEYARTMMVAQRAAEKMAAATQLLAQNKTPLEDFGESFRQIIEASKTQIQGSDASRGMKEIAMAMAIPMLGFNQTQVEAQIAAAYKKFRSTLPAGEREIMLPKAVLAGSAEGVAELQRSKLQQVQQPRGIKEELELGRRIQEEQLKENQKIVEELKKLNEAGFVF